MLAPFISTVAVVEEVAELACPAGLYVIQAPSLFCARQHPSHPAIGFFAIGKSSKILFTKSSAVALGFWLAGISLGVPGPPIGIPGNFPSFKSFTALVFNTELGALFVKSGPVGFLPIRSKAAFSSSTIELPLVFLWNQPLLQASYPRHFPTRHYRWCSRVRR